MKFINKSGHKFFLVLALLSYVSISQAGEAIDESRSVAVDARISMEFFNGNITLMGWDKAEFHIEGELSENAEGFTLQERNGNIYFEEEHGDYDGWGCFVRRHNCNSNRGSGSGAELTIYVPAESLVELDGLNVDVAVSALTGSTKVELTNGDIDGKDLSGIISLETINGSIDTRNLAGRVNLGTVNGRINDRDSSASRAEFSAINGSITSNIVSERINVQSVSGRVDLSLGEIKELEVSSVSGSLEVSAAMLQHAYINISTVSGRTILTLPADTSARFDINTAVGGRIENNLSDDESVEKNRYINSSSLLFSLNGGSDGDVGISTVTGSVTLEASR